MASLYIMNTRVDKSLCLLVSSEYGRAGKAVRAYNARLDANVPFDGLCGLLKNLGFEEHIKGDHHIFSMGGVKEILNMQPNAGKGKPYQVQVRGVILKYNLTLED